MACIFLAKSWLSSVLARRGGPGHNSSFGYTEFVVRLYPVFALSESSRQFAWLGRNRRGSRNYPIRRRVWSKEELHPVE